MRFYVFFAVLALWTAVVTSDEYVVGEIETFDVGIDSTNTTGPDDESSSVTAPTTTIQTTTIRRTPSDELTETDQIIIGVTCGIAGLVLIGAIVYGCAKRQHDNNNSTDDYPVNDTTPSETTTLRETTAPSGTTARGFILTPSNIFSDTDRAIIAITVVVCGLVFFGVAFYGCAKHQQTKKEKNKLYKKYLSVANGPDLGTDNLAFSR